MLERKCQIEPAALVQRLRLSALRHAPAQRVEETSIIAHAQLQVFFFHHSRRLPQRGPAPGKDRLTIPQAKRRQLLQFVSQLSRDLLGRDLSVNLQHRFQIGSAQAQASGTWVSEVGDDVNPCSRTAPCKTFARAISKTAAGGEIDASIPPATAP